MKTFNAALINEIEKLLKRKKVIIIAVISLFMIIVGQFVVISMNYGTGIRTVSGTAFPILILSLFANTILPLFIALAVIDTFSGEFSNNTIKLAMLRPISRLKLYIVKIVAVCFFAAISLFIMMVFSTLSGFLFNDFSINFKSLYNIFISYAITIIPVIMIVLIVVFLTNIIRSGTLLFFICVIIFVLLKGLAFVLPEYATIFVTPMLNWYNLWIYESIPLSKIIREFLIMFGCSTMFFTGGYYLFEKKSY